MLSLSLCCFRHGHRRVNAVQFFKGPKDFRLINSHWLYISHQLHYHSVRIILSFEPLNPGTDFQHLPWKNSSAPKPLVYPASTSECVPSHHTWILQSWLPPLNLRSQYLPVWEFLSADSHLSDATELRGVRTSVCIRLLCKECSCWLDLLKLSLHQQSGCSTFLSYLCSLEQHF